MINVIEYLADDDNFMEKLCADCEEIRHCPAEKNPFYEYGCVRESDLKDIEEAVEALERLIEGVAAA